MEVVLGYSRSKGQYHVEEIRGSSPVAEYQRSTVPDFRVLLNDPDFVQVEAVRVQVGDWLTEEQAEKLGGRTALIVRPYIGQGG